MYSGTAIELRDQGLWARARRGLLVMRRPKDIRASTIISFRSALDVRRVCRRQENSRDDSIDGS